MSPMELGDENNLEQLIYVSSASFLMSDEELLDILETSRIKNEFLNVSGMLVYSEGTFMHVLEGTPNILSCLYDIIQRDPRHHRCFLLLRQPIQQRSFEGWSMGFRPTSNIDLEEIPGYINFFGDRPVPERGAAAYRILSSFRKQHDRELHYAAA